MIRIGSPAFAEKQIDYFKRQDDLLGEDNLKNQGEFSHIDCYDLNYFIHLPSPEFLSEIKNEKILIIDVKYPQYNVLRMESVVKIFNTEQQLMDKIDALNFYDLNKILAFLKNRDEYKNIKIEIFKRITQDQENHSYRYIFNINDFIKKIVFKYYIIEFQRTKFGPEGHIPIEGGIYLKNMNQGLYFHRYLDSLFDETIFTTYSDPRDGDKESAKQSFYSKYDTLKVKKSLETQVQIIEKFDVYAYWRSVLEQISEELNAY